MPKKSLIWLGAVLFFSSAFAAEELDWIKDYNQALSQAGKESKKVLIDFYSPT